MKKNKIERPRIMKKPVYILCCFIVFINVLWAQSYNNSKSVVFESGKEGHKSYRIPAMIALTNGMLLAFCEGRVNGAGDFGDINIVLKRSADNGETWSRLQTIVDADSLQAGNPAPVVDLNDPAFPHGRIFLFYNTGNNSEGEVRKGKGLREVWYITSVDGGSTWSKPQNITAQVHHPAQSPYNDSTDWRSYSNTPGHALQIKEGVYKGRIYVAANHSDGEPKNNFEDYHAHGFYSDDHGRTFHLSETVGLPGGNESTAAEISNSGLMLNARNQKGDIKARIIARSNDGGETWQSIAFDKNLPDPVCEGSMLNVGKQKEKHILAFSNAADTVNRNNLTLRISFDEGLTWPKKILVDGSDINPKDYSAYSDIAVINSKDIGVLYENDNYKTIVFKVIRWRN
jgi:sialidase-1